MFVVKRVISKVLSVWVILHFSYWIFSKKITKIAVVQSILFELKTINPGSIYKKPASV
jgi:hypothetical protein